MSGAWEKTFEVAVPLERLWQAFTNDEEYGRLLSWPGAPAVHEADPVRHEVSEHEPLKRIVFQQEKGLPDTRAEFTITLEPTAQGSRFTISRRGFGEGEEADVFGEANFLGFCHGFRDLILYLETGASARRRYVGCSQSATGMLFREREWGIEILGVRPGSFAEEAGLARGDRVLRIGNAAIFTRNDVWSLTMEHPPQTELSIEFVRGRERLKSKARLSPTAYAAVGE